MDAMSGSQLVTTVTRSAGDLKSYSFDEVAAHDKPDDCWLVVSGQVYNVTDFVPTHPGGNMIYVNAGKDSTFLFESYHPSYVRWGVGHQTEKLCKLFWAASERLLNCCRDLL